MEVIGPECVCVVERTTFCSVYTPGYSWSSLSRAYFFTIWPIIPEQMVTYATTENSAKYSNSKRAVNNLSHRNFGQTWPKRAGKVCLATSCLKKTSFPKYKAQIWIFWDFAENLRWDLATVSATTHSPLFGWWQLVRCSATFPLCFLKQRMILPNYFATFGSGSDTDSSLSRIWIRV